MLSTGMSTFIYIRLRLSTSRQVRLHCCAQVDEDTQTTSTWCRQRYTDPSVYPPSTPVDGPSVY
ncbi:hypothetical protein B0H12DRAFT_1114105 [Mycena haematopus]|nr:hypothetical protein B0H12DRAFT_1114105 [Mycena haematopus]